MPDAFGFRTTQVKPAADNLPDSFTFWPTLPVDQLAASIQPQKKARELQGEDLDESDDANINSILAVADDSGSIQFFLDGTYPLGLVTVDPDAITVSLAKAPRSNVLLAFRSHMDKTLSHSFTSLLPAKVNLSLLSSRIPRDVAQLSSAAHQLCLYAYRTVDDLRTVWMGTSSQPGSRFPGLRWLKKLADLQPERYACTSISSATKNTAHMKRSDGFRLGQD